MKRFLKIALFSILIIAGEAFACTIAVVSESAAGYPMLWKNRDVHSYDQEMRFFDTTPYSFTANIYRGETHRAWAGLNSQGFAVVNTDTYNQGAWGISGLDDGEIMFWALATCNTIDDFEDYLDSTNVAGRRSTHCYGAIDAFGGAAVFEAGRYDYTRFDADEAPNGVLIRTNYADTGTDTLTGENRRLRAEEILSLSSSIDPYLFLFILARDLVVGDFDPYPLPFMGTHEDLPPGCISTHSTINRYYSTSATVIQGIGKTGAPGVIWAYLGQPILSIPVPLWVETGEVPDELGSSTGSVLCRMAQDFRSLVYTTPTTVNTYPLADLRTFFFTDEQEIYSEIQSLYSIGPTAFEDYSYLANVQQDIAERVLGTYYALHELFVREWGHSLPSSVDLNCYPNPFNSVAQISVFVPSPSYAEVRLYDMTGKLASIPLARKMISAGKTTFRISSSGLSSGVYLATLVVGGEIKATKRLVLVE